MSMSSLSWLSLQLWQEDEGDTLLSLRTQELQVSETVKERRKRKKKAVYHVIAKVSNLYSLAGVKMSRTRGVF